jgi:hypothetical protein
MNTEATSRYPGELDEKAEPSFTCPRCGRTSYNPNDIGHSYCAACHLCLEDPGPIGALAMREEDICLTVPLGFIYARSLEDGRFLGIEPTLGHGALLKLSSDRDPLGVCEDVWQYTKAAFAMHSAATWDPAQNAEPFGWYRHPPTGRRRPHGNPQNEYIRP